MGNKQLFNHLDDTMIKVTNLGEVAYSKVPTTSNHLCLSLLLSVSNHTINQSYLTILIQYCCKGFAFPTAIVGSHPPLSADHEGIKKLPTMKITVSQHVSLTLAYDDYCSASAIHCYYASL